MIKQCHDYIIDIKSFTENDKQYSFCIVRNRKIILRPEEIVRQAFLIMLHKELNINFEDYNIKVEYKNLDIVVYNKFEIDSFNPNDNAVVIFELKRDEENLITHKEQLLRYLKSEFCEVGILFNCKSIFRLSKSNNFEITKIDKQEISNVIENGKREKQNDEIEFEKAKQGNLESFKQLAKKYSHTNNIKFKCIDYSAPITAYYFDFENNRIKFSICNYRKTLQIDEKDFIELIAIQQSC